MMRRISRVGIKQSRSPGWKRWNRIVLSVLNLDGRNQTIPLVGMETFGNTSEPDSVYVGIHQSRSPGWKPKDEDPSGQITLGRN